MDIKSKKDIAKIYFVNHNHSLVDISRLLGVSKNTLSKWNKDGKWDVLKAAQASRSDEIISRSYDQINQILKIAEKEERALTESEADKMAKISKSIQQLQTKATLSHVIEVSEELILFIKDINSDLAVKVADIFLQYVQKKAQQYNGGK